MPRIFPLAMAALAAACSTTVQGGAAPDAPRVVGVSVRGAEEVDDDKVIGGLATQPPRKILWLIPRVYRRLDRLAMVQDVSRIESFYARQGFYSAEVKTSRVEPAGSGVRVIFEVDEGEPTRVAELVVDGLQEDLEDTRPLEEHTAPLRRGQIFRHDRYVALKSWLGAWMAHQGYPHAEIQGKVAVDRDERTASIRITVDHGPEARFGQTLLRGLEHLPESVVRNRLAYRSGDEFDPGQLELTQGRLYKLGLFGAVRMDYEREGRPEITDVAISLTEAGRHEMRLGGGVRVEGGFQSSNLKAEVRGRADYLMRRFLHPLATLRVDARPAWQFLVDERRNGPAGEASATVERVDLFAPLLTGNVSVGYQADEYEAYSQRGPMARLGVSRPFLSDRLLLAASYRVRQLTFHSLSPALDDATAAEIGLTSPYRVGFVEESIAYDLRDHPLSPRSGIYAQLSAAQGAEALAGTASFLRGTAELRGYLPLGQRLVLAGRGAYGRALQSGLPITERFFGGGAAGHRGFGYRELAPFITDEEGNTLPIGGEALALGSAEARFDLMKIRSYPFGVVGFFDAGDVTSRPEDLELGNLHYAAGLGLRYDPVVAFRLDVGYRINRFGPGEPDPGGRFAFHFSLGQAF